MVEIEALICEWITNVLEKAGILCDTRIQRDNLFQAIEKIVYDTRYLLQSEEKALFVALRGKRDGHQYLKDAYEKGIRFFLVEHLDISLPGAVIWVVKDTLRALQELAKAKRQTFKALVIAITGSNGKTIVKEWIYWLLSCVGKSVYRAPRSFNSQLGVPLALLQCPSDVEVAIFEAGISRQGEMEKLANLITPEIGIFTNLGSAHDEGFSSRLQKLNEKLRLFKSCRQVIVKATEKKVCENLGEKALPVEEAFQLRIERNGDEIWIKHFGKVWHVPFPIQTSWVDFNLTLVLGLCLHLGISLEELIPFISQLPHVEMRMQILMPHGNLCIINDTYNADYESFYHAFHYLITRGIPPIYLFFTPLEEVGSRDRVLHERIFRLVQSHLRSENVYFIGGRWEELARQFGFQVYKSVDELLKEIPFPFFTNLEGTILLKGARRYRLERLLPYLGEVNSYPRLEIDLEAMAHNVKLIHSLFPERVKVILLLKASAYGVGAWQIASFFESQNYIMMYGVAHVHEGVFLRKHGIRKPILVLIPGPIEPYFTFNLTPAVSSLEFLKTLELEARARQQKLAVHLEWDTGMSRLGFLPDQIKDVLELCQSLQFVYVEGIFSHLTSADEVASDEWTKHQIKIFRQIEEAFRKNGFPHIVAHIQNSAGALRFPNEQFDAIRVGIGAYAPGFLTGTTRLPFEEVATLKGQVIRVQNYPKGTSVGYNRRYKSNQRVRIATVNLGYADGIPYQLSNTKYHVVIRGQKVPLVGSICMDMCMVDVTRVSEIRVGDEVLFFGKQGDLVLPLHEMARLSATIPYDILCRISPRVARFYLK